MEKVHRWRVLLVRCKKRGNWPVHLRSKQTSPNHKFPGWGKDTTIFKGERFHKDSIFHICTRFKTTEKFQYTRYTSCHAPGVKKVFINGEALRLLRTNSSETKVEKNICNFKSNLRIRDYPDYLVNKVLAEVKLTNRRSAFEQKPLRVQSRLMPFATQYNPSVPNVKNIWASGI